MSANGQDGEPMSVSTGLPPGPPVSPVLVAIYIAEIQVEGSRGISLVDGVTWIVEGADLDDVFSKLERCAKASPQWADGNVVRLRPLQDRGNPLLPAEEAPPLREASEWRTRRCTLPRRQRAGWGSGKTQHSTLAENRKRRIGKTRQAEARLRRIVSQYRAPLRQREISRWR